MKDPRIEKLANLLVDYSVRLKPRDIVAINGEAVAAPLVQACYRAALRRGAFVVCDVVLDNIAEIFYAEASKEQLQWVSPLALHKVKKIDASIGIWGDMNTKGLSNVDPKRLALASSARKPISKLFMDRAATGDLRWVGTQWPCHASAQDAEMSLEEYEDFVYGAGYLDDPDPVATWKRIAKEQQALADFLNRRQQIRILAEDTDLTFSVKGNKWLNSAGHHNFPDGEVFTGPVEKTVEGHVKFSFPAVHSGREADGVRLTFEKGKVVKSEASKGQEFLRAMIAMDKGSCYLGEAAFGTNYNVKRYTKNTLFDEKIGGTIHLALGAGYPETGNCNRSGLHWDMMCDLRNGGEIYADGELIQKNGRFLNRRFPQP